MAAAIFKSGKGGIKVLHLVIIALSLAMTVGAWQFSRAQMAEQIEARFDAAKKQTLDLITARMGNYRDALFAGTAAIRSHGGEVTRAEWQEFASNLHLPERYPGVGGVSVVRYLGNSELPVFVAAQQRDRAEFKVHPAHPHPVHAVVTYFEPEAPNAAAIGLDLTFEENRRIGAFKSRDSGEAQISGPIQLVQDAGHTAGFLFYAPFYRGETPMTVEARREQIAGYVMAPFVVKKLMRGLLAADRRMIRFNIMDAGEVIHDELSSDDPNADPSPMYRKTVALDLYGRMWEVEMETNLAFRVSNTSAQPTLILAGGLLIEILIIGMLMMMARSNRSAVSYADRVTVDLKEKSQRLGEANNDLEMTNAELARSNAELEQFAYVASHDLKTPIRGIGSLAEMIEEDLEPYFQSPDADPEILENLKRIHERVARMNSLTTGIMQYSRVDQTPIEDGVLDLAHMLEAIRLDFGLTDEQLVLSGDAPSVRYDSRNFQRVVENLIGNAVKYHDGKTPLQISMAVTQRSDRVEVSVADNGPGIDPEYHEKIFGVFQTLRMNGEAESSGIGLSIVKKAVERNQGTIRVAATEGGGATFRYDWPNPLADQMPQSTNEAA